MPTVSQVSLFLCALTRELLDEYKKISPVFEEDVYEAISLKTCVEKRLTLGAPGPEVMNKVIALYDEYMEKNQKL